MSTEQGMTPLTDEELMAQGGTALPDKEVASVLDLNADLDLGISAAAPIDLGRRGQRQRRRPDRCGCLGEHPLRRVRGTGPRRSGRHHQPGHHGATPRPTSTQDSTIDQGTGHRRGTETAADCRALPARTGRRTRRRRPAGRLRTRPLPDGTAAGRHAAGRWAGHRCRAAGPRRRPAQRQRGPRRRRRHRGPDQRCGGGQRQRGRADRRRRGSQHRLDRQRRVRRGPAGRHHHPAHRRRSHGLCRPAVRPRSSSPG